MLSLFIGLTALVVAIIVWFMYYPLKSVHPGESESNIAISKDKLQELQKEVEQGTLSESDVAFYEAEVTQSLASDITEQKVLGTMEHSHQTPTRSHITTLVTAIVFAVFVYVTYGFAKFTPPVELDANNIASIEAFIEANPNDVKAYRLLGFAHSSQNNHPEAVAAYGQALKLAEITGTPSVTILTEYAVALATLQDSYQGTPTSLIVRALNAYPEAPEVLYLAGVVAANNADYAMADMIWRRALSFAPEGSEEQSLLITVLAELEQFLSEQQPNVTLEVITEISEATYKEFFDGYIMIFARSSETPMPIAIVRTPMAEFTGNATLSDENAVMPTNALSNFTNVDISVRLSKTGMAVKGEDDIEFTQPNIAVKNQTIEFSIP